MERAHSLHMPLIYIEYSSSLQMYVNVCAYGKTLAKYFQSISVRSVVVARTIAPVGSGFIFYFIVRILKLLLEISRTSSCECASHECICLNNSLLCASKTRRFCVGSFVIYLAPAFFYSSLDWIYFSLHGKKDHCKVIVKVIVQN